jgi:hypothetical protein
MRKVHSGFVQNSGVQNHSAGEDYPITHYCVGGFPRDGNDAYWVVQAPCGFKRKAYTAWVRDNLVQTFKECQKWVDEADTSIISEKTAFQLAFLAEKKRGGEIGWPLDWSEDI